MSRRILLTGLLSVAGMTFLAACHGHHGHYCEYSGAVSVHRTTTTTTSEQVTPNPACGHGCHGHGHCGHGCCH